MGKENTFAKIKLILSLLILVFPLYRVSFAQKPILTDEFDRFLVTKETKIGDVIGQIELVFLNPKKKRMLSIISLQQIR